MKKTSSLYEKFRQSKVDLLEAIDNIKKILDKIPEGHDFFEYK